MATPLKTVLVDTGPLVSIIRFSQPKHRACVEALKAIHLPLYTCWPVLTEAAFLLRHRADEVQALLSGFSAGFLQIVPLIEDDVTAIQSILKRFDDQDFDLADACLMHLAEREDVDAVFTLDERDFGIYRTVAGKALPLLPLIE